MTFKGSLQEITFQENKKSYLSFRNIKEIFVDNFRD